MKKHDLFCHDELLIYDMHFEMTNIFKYYRK